MNTTMRPLAFLIVGAILAACATGQPVTPASAAQCVPHGAANNVCQDVGVVVDSAASHTAHATIDELVIPRNAKNVHIYWSLSDGNCRFDTASGVLLKEGNGNGQFSDQFATNGRDDAPQPAASAQRFHWRDRNTDNNVYRYKIRFTCGSDPTPYLVDPAIRNQN